MTVMVGEALLQTTVCARAEWLLRKPHVRLLLRIFFPMTRVDMAWGALSPVRTWTQ